MTKAMWVAVDDRGDLAAEFPGVPVGALGPRYLVSAHVEDDASAPPEIVDWRHFAIHRTDWAESARAAEDVVRWSWFALLDRAWTFSAINVPVAAAIHDETEFLVFGTST